MALSVDGERQLAHHGGASANLPLPDASTVGASIRLIRDQKVILDSDLAAFYGVSTKNLNKAVARNAGRFPFDFMFRLTREEFDALRFQSGTSKPGRGGRRFLPYAFTEHGALQLSSVLNSDRAEQVGVFIVRAFVRLRQVLVQDLEMAKRLVELEAKIGKHDRVLKQLADAARDFIRDQSKLKARVKKLEQPPELPPPPNLRRIR